MNLEIHLFIHEQFVLNLEKRSYVKQCSAVAAIFNFQSSQRTNVFRRLEGTFQPCLISKWSSGFKEEI